jgi:ribosomal protein S15P/S13E
MTDETPVSWLLIEPGWDVVASDGHRVGKVAERVGDSNVDIFDGLSVSPGLVSKDRYVPAEQVALITQGTVRLKITSEEFNRDADYEEPPESDEILAETASRRQRLWHYIKRGLFIRD